MSNPTDPSLYAMQQATLAAAERTAAALERIADTMEGKPVLEVAERSRDHETYEEADMSYGGYRAKCIDCGWRSLPYKVLDIAEYMGRNHVMRNARD